MAKQRKTDVGPDLNSFPEQVVSANPAPAGQSAGGILWAIASLSMVLAFMLYHPALNGPFLFDDMGLPFYQPSFPQESFKAWISGVRPLLMFTYWTNFQLSAREPWTYHAFNVALHAANTILVFLLVSRLLGLLKTESRRALFCAAVAASIFLVHPLQTEAVAYIAGRSELVCGFFVLAALVVFCRPEVEKFTIARAASILALYGCAVLSKEQAAVLPVLFLAIDYSLKKRSIREAVKRGAWLYGPITIAAGAAVVAVAALLSRSSTAGFNVAGMRWYDYLFTQFRVWLLYVDLSILPLRQNADYDLAISRSLAEHGAVLALGILIAAAAGVWMLRERLPLLFCGAVAFAVLLAPTSSVVPLQDLAAERRMYLPLLGLLVIAVQMLVRMQVNQTVTTGLTAYLLILAALTHERAKTWSSDTALWTEVTKSSPNKARGYTHLAYSYIRSGQCHEAIEFAPRVPEKIRETPVFLGVLGQAYACERRLPEAVNAFERAAMMGPQVGRVLALASIYRRVGRYFDAEVTEQQARRLPPRTPYDFHMLAAAEAAEEATRSRSSDR